MKDKIEAALALLDDMADDWIEHNRIAVDEEHYRHARNMLREALQATADDSEPITAEWCLANGATNFWDGSNMWAMWQQGFVNVAFSSKSKAIELLESGDPVELTSITTRGRLRHLLAALGEGDQ